jgi:hypothetical protein
MIVVERYGEVVPDLPREGFLSEGTDHVHEIIVVDSGLIRCDTVIRRERDQCGEFVVVAAEQARLIFKSTIILGRGEESTREELTIAATRPTIPRSL